MSVSVYNNTDCKYRIPRLDKYVYLISDYGIGNIRIDDGEAYIERIMSNPIILKCYDVSVSESEELDERYAFTHTVSCSMLGYHSVDDIFSKYVIVIKDMEGTYWVMNPEFPAKVTYTYTLDGNSSHTDFTIGTISNYPMLRVRNMDEIVAEKPCVGYNPDGFKSLQLNESKYTRRKDSEILVTNSGFKNVVFDKESASFTETFDGDNVSHTITFNIPLDSYNDSWHYNLLEFLDNNYSAIIGTKEGRNILCGFGFGLQPSYSISGGVNDTDTIEVTLSDMHSTGDFIGLTDISFDKDDITNFVWAPDLGYECVGDGVARYIIQRQVDGLGNPTGRYRCLKGYEEHFREIGYNIVDTFEGNTTFQNLSCKGAECQFQSTMPYTITFNSENCKTYSVICDTDWTLESDSDNVTVEPSEGGAGVPYDVQVCARRIDGGLHHITAKYCNGLKMTYDVRLEFGNPCFTAGQTFDISANAQYVNVPITCCTQSAYDLTGVVADITISGYLMKAYVPQNSTGAMREIVIEVKMCDGSTVEVTINQSSGFERWIYEGSECNGNGQRCDIERRYTGTTAGLINTRTNETRYVNCVDDPICGFTTRWVSTDETYCEGGKRYFIEKEQYLEGGVWKDSGNSRVGNETSDPKGECALPEEEWKTAEGYICDGTVKYRREQQYLNGIAQDVYRKTDVIIEVDSEDCGYITGTDEWYCEKWEDVAGEYICDRGMKYTKQQRYVRNCDICLACDEPWIATGTYRKGSVIDWTSEDCGWLPEYSDYGWQEWREEEGYICNGYDKYSVERLYLSNDGENWIRTDVTGNGTLLEKNSFDCGYIPTERCSDWKFEGYGCDGTTKYEILRKWISDDCSERWYRTEITKFGNVIEDYSSDCGWDDGYEYGWRLTDETTCVGYDKYRLYVYQRRRSGGQWSDVYPTQKSYNGNGSMEPVLYEKDSEECGYVKPLDPVYALKKDGTVCDECGINDYDERWVSSGYMCDGYDKYVKEVKEISFDRGDTYSLLLPEESRKGSLVEVNSMDCGYELDPMYKWEVSGEVCEECFDGFAALATFKDGTTQTYNCNPDARINNPKITNNKDLVSLKIGTCVTDMLFYDFHGCTSLSSITIDTVSIYTFNGFSGCTSITDIILPETTISIWIEALAYCKSLVSVTMPNTVRTINRHAFNECEALSCSLPLENVTTIGDMAFNNCKNLKEIKVSRKLNEIGTRAFYGCSSLKLTQITPTDNIYKIGEYAFYGCEKLTEITLPDTINTIGTAAFCNCSSLKIDLIIPKNVLKIADYAFLGCSSLRSITIHEKVESVGMSSFGMCTSLESITILVDGVLSISSYGSFNGTNDCPIYVPENRVDSYKKSTNWQNFRDRIKPII